MNSTEEGHICRPLLGPKAFSFFLTTLRELAAFSEEWGTSCCQKQVAWTGSKDMTCHGGSREQVEACKMGKKNDEGGRGTGD